MVIEPREKTIALTIVCKHVGGTGLTPAGAPSTRVQAIAWGRRGRQGCRRDGEGAPRDGGGPRRKHILQLRAVEREESKIDLLLMLSQLCLL